MGNATAVAVLLTGIGGIIAGLAALTKALLDNRGGPSRAERKTDQALRAMGETIDRLEHENKQLRADVADLRREISELRANR